MKTMLIALTTTLLAVAGLAHSAELPRTSCPAGFAITKDNLKDVLTNLGYKPEKLSDTSYRLMVERNNITFAVSVSLSKDETKLWMSSYVSEIADINKVPASVLEKMLSANADFGPTHFSLESSKTPEGRRVYISRPMDNQGLTPAIVRETLDRFQGNVAGAQPLWDATKWPAAR